MAPLEDAPGTHTGVGDGGFHPETTWHVVGNQYIFYSRLWKVSGKTTLAPEHLDKGEKGCCGRAETGSHLAVSNRGGDLDPTSLWASVFSSAKWYGASLHITGRAGSADRE